MSMGVQLCLSLHANFLSLPCEIYARHKQAALLTPSASSRALSRLPSKLFLKSLHSHLQDTTSHPLWTGGDRKLSVKEGQAAKFMQRYAGWGQDEAARQPKVLQEASAQQGQPPRLTG